MKCTYGIKVLLLATVIHSMLAMAEGVQEPDMILTLLPAETTSPGGKCMDGTQAGYYLREGTDKSLFVIYLKGGGGCSTQEECEDRITKPVGTSANWADSMVGINFLDKNCVANPDFCDATAVHVPYCTSDGHRGTITEPSNTSFGYYFDGRTNFAHIVDKLIAENGLGDADKVMLTGGSAGSIGAIFNVDFLADKLPNATVKAVPLAGWYNPAALSDDLLGPYSPSDYAHFAIDTHGNPTYDMVQAGMPVVDIWGWKESASPACLDYYGDDQWWACASAHFAYKYIRSPLYVIHTQYDSNQIFTQNLAPRLPANDPDTDTVKRYVQMWGNATRESMQMIIEDNLFSEKVHKDGVFSASCITHGTSKSVTIDGYSYKELVHDWFFQNRELEDHYELIESCTPLEGNEDYVIPCNVNSACHYKPVTSNREKVEMCAKRLYFEGCLASFGASADCLTCARKNSDALKQASCTVNMVTKICNYAERNEIVEEFEGRTIKTVDSDFNAEDPSGLFNSNRPELTFSGGLSRSILFSLFVAALVSSVFFLNFSK
eukprot:CAMPEP_0195286300 /NCGR_PEP_ID=MMETSP0707-20130614/3809_1 /TAXON_ID=33640 /ORGANISM="Asterionellopsis glacialis, Strain CCMP134" /LENGTH=547 /DNA_ID=CAMNT_0040345921 /DNA_START=21 /DNA_END=1664 /DNA_ORIENTATION=+